MLTAEAHVQTEHPDRYLVQLCRHAQQVHRLRHRPPMRKSCNGFRTSSAGTSKGSAAVTT